MKKRNLIPLLIMLLAGLISSLISIKNRYDVTRSLLVIFVAMLIFYFVGLIARSIVNSNVKQMEEREAERLRQEEEEKRLQEEALLAEAAEKGEGENTETGTRAAGVAEDMQII